MPLFARKFLTDFIETGVAAVFALQVVLPTTTDEGIRIAGIVGSAVLAALISAARRAIPDFMVWVRERLGTAPQ